MEKEQTSCTTPTGLERGRCEIDAFVYDLIQTGCSAGEVIWCHVFMADCSFMAVFMPPCSTGTQQAFCSYNTLFCFFLFLIFAFHITRETIHCVETQTVTRTAGESRLLPRCRQLLTLASVSSELVWWFHPRYRLTGRGPSTRDGSGVGDKPPSGATECVAGGGGASTQHVMS